MVFNGTYGLIKKLCLLWFLLLAPGVFAAVPIQGASLNGAAAANARLALISEAESFLGTPYRYAGLDRSGLDCSGLVYVSFREALNVSIPRTADAIYKWTEKIPTNELQPGDLVFFVTSGQKISHVGIYAGNNRFIHSASEGPRTGVMYSNLDESYWKRTYYGAGRALPWDIGAAQAMAEGRPVSNQEGNLTVNPGGIYPEGSNSNNMYSGSILAEKSSKPPVVWADPGFFAGFGLAWTWGGFIEGAPSVFRGFSTMATVGYKWSKYRLGFELRPEWDRALGVFRFPFTLSIGTNYFQFFAGPAITFGEPDLSLSNGERHYSGGGDWLWEAGFSCSIPFFKIKSGALAVYGELAWQPYYWGKDTKFSFKPDFTANFRFSTGFRYLWRL